MKVKTIHSMFGLVRYESWKSGWAEKDEVDELSYISSQCNPEDVLLSSRLFFPDFVVDRNGVFLESKYDGGVVRCWLDQFNGDVQATEKMINLCYCEFSACAINVLRSCS